MIRENSIKFAFWYPQKKYFIGTRPHSFIQGSSRAASAKLNTGDQAENACFLTLSRKSVRLWHTESRKHPGTHNFHTQQSNVERKKNWLFIAEKTCTSISQDTGKSTPGGLRTEMSKQSFKCLKRINTFLPLEERRIS